MSPPGTRPTEFARPIEFAGVTKVYPGTAPVTALSDVDLTISARELVAIVGASGSGKSTLMNLMGGLDLPTCGTVKIAGQDLSSLSDSEISALRGRSIGFVFQNFYLLGQLSVLENVLLGTMYLGGDWADRQQEAADIVASVGLAHRIEHRATDLSGGERQRVAVARALVGSPTVLLADEPTGNLDSATSTSIVELLLGVHAGGTTVVIITHDQALSAKCDRVVRIRDGRVASE